MTPRRIRVIFLDFDGVLNAGYTKEYGFNYALPEAIAFLNGLTRAMGAVIVVSSSWRIAHTLAEIRVILKDWGVEAPVIDVTPELLDAANYPAARITEIEAWLNLQPAGRIESYVVLDDDEIELDIHNEPLPNDEILARFVRTVTTSGLTEADVMKAARILLTPLSAP